MIEVHTGPIDVLPEGAVALMTADHVMRLRGDGYVFCGQVECDLVRPGDRVVAVVAGPVCRGVVSGIERFCEQVNVARRGDEVGIMIRGWGGFSFAPGVRLYRVPKL